jgi:hypothetical protein
MKRRVLKYLILCVFSIILLSLSFMTGRYSWLIGKPGFLLGSRENFWVQKAKELMVEDGVAEERLKVLWLHDAVIVRLRIKDANDYGGADIVLDETSGRPLQWTLY